MVRMQHQNRIQKIRLLGSKFLILPKHIQNILGNGVIFSRVMDHQALPVEMMNLALVGVAGYRWEFRQKINAL